MLLTALLTLLHPTLSDKACFDTNAGGHAGAKTKNAGTKCTICIANVEDCWPGCKNFDQYDDRMQNLSDDEFMAILMESRGISGMGCKNGVRVGLTYDDCIINEAFSKNKDVMISTSCGDGMWLDRLWIEPDKVTDAGVSQPWKARGSNRNIGKSNNSGWCISRDRGDYDAFDASVVNADHVPTTYADKYRTSDTCYSTMRFNTDGSTYGWQNSDHLNIYRPLGHTQANTQWTAAYSNDAHQAQLSYQGYPATNHAGGRRRSEAQARKDLIHAMDGEHGWVYLGQHLETGGDDPSHGNDGNDPSHGNDVSGLAQELVERIQKLEEILG